MEGNAINFTKGYVHICQYKIQYIFKNNPEINILRIEYIFCNIVNKRNSKYEFFTFK